jgi:hypothetical protein
MKHRPFAFLVLAAWELARFYIIAAFVSAPQSPAGYGTVVFVLAPQLLFAAAFFFLWFDYGQYSPYRPLLLAAKCISLLAAVVFVFAVLGRSGADGSLVAVVTRFRATVLVGAGDAIAIAILALSRTPVKTPRDSVPITEGKKPSIEAPTESAIEDVSDDQGKERE